MPSSWKGDELGFLPNWKWSLPRPEKTEPMKATVCAAYEQVAPLELARAPGLAASPKKGNPKPPGFLR